MAGLPGAWDPEPLVLAGAAVAAVLFGRAFVRLRRRGRADHASWARAVLFACGLAVVAVPLVSPLDAAGDGYLLSAHMLEHVLIGDAGPALLVLAVRGPLLAFAVPAGVARYATRRRWLRGLLRRLRQPALALTVWAAAIAVWHVPAAYDAALTRPWLHTLEHATFFAAGLLVWVVLIDPSRSGHLPVGVRAALAGGVFMLGQLLCAVLLLSPSPLYPAYAHAGVRLFGLSPLSDQQYAGLVMMAEQLLTLGTCVALLGASLLRQPTPARAGIPAS
jgi:cytochrome c oxidase assembly factor CtaG